MQDNTWLATLLFAFGAFGFLAVAFYSSEGFWTVVASLLAIFFTGLTLASIDYDKLPWR